MTDVFISYARSNATQAQQLAEALRGLGYGVWRDDALPAHRAYAEVIDERLAAAKAVVVIWSADAVRSEWVQSEAAAARTDRKLVQLAVDRSRLPGPFDRIQCADLAGWNGDLNAPGWRKIAASVAELMGASAPAPRRMPAILWLPLYEPLRRDPRFVTLCAKLGLRDYWTNTGRWPDCADPGALPYDFKAECRRMAAV